MFKKIEEGEQIIWISSQVYNIFRNGLLIGSKHLFGCQYSIYIEYSGPEITDAVSQCKGNVIKFLPLGAYPEGSQQVITALSYCGTLG